MREATRAYGGRPNYVFTVVVKSPEDRVKFIGLNEDSTLTSQFSSGSQLEPSLSLAICLVSFIYIYLCFHLIYAASHRLSIIIHCLTRASSASVYRPICTRPVPTHHALSLFTNVAITLLSSATVLL